MRVPIEMQQLGPNIESGTIVAWLMDVGERVTRGEPLIEVETEKATLEMEALDSGVLVEITQRPDVEVPVGAIIGYLETDPA